MTPKRNAVPIVNEKNGTQSIGKDSHFTTQKQRFLADSALFGKEAFNA